MTTGLGALDIERSIPVHASEAHDGLLAVLLLAPPNTQTERFGMRFLGSLFVSAALIMAANAYRP